MVSRRWLIHRAVGGLFLQPYPPYDEQQERITPSNGEIYKELIITQGVVAVHTASIENILEAVDWMMTKMQKPFRQVEEGDL